MPRALVAVALLTVCLPSFLLLPVSVSASPLALARSRITAGDRAGARVLLDALLASGDSLSASLRMEAEFLRAGLEESGASYEERLRTLLDRGLDRERQGWAHLALGQIAYVRGDFAVAVREFGKAREEGRPDEGSLWEGLASSALGDVEIAHAALGRAGRSKNPVLRDRALFALGSSYRTGEDWAAARSTFSKVREGGPEGSWWSAAALAEGECLEQLGDAAGAATLYRELLERRPDAYEAPLAFARLAAAPAETPPATLGAEGPQEPTYSVQLGAFADPANAQAFARALEQRHISPVRVVQSDHGLHRVLVGGGLPRARAESLGDSLGTALGVGFSLSVEGGGR